MRILLFFCGFLFTFLSSAKEPKVDKITQSNNLVFIENKGQWNSGFQMMADIPGGAFFAEKNALRFQFFDQNQFGKAAKEHLHTKYHFLENNLKWHSYLMTFVGGNEFNWQGGKQSEGYSNYMLGNNKSNWVSNVSSYQSISTQEVYDGVQMKLYSKNGNFKYDFIVAPGVNTDVIKWKYAGLDEIKMRGGEIFLKTSVNQIVELEPVAYQIIEGEKRDVLCVFEENNGVFGFKFPEGYHTGYPLIIDPEVVFSTFSGSSVDNFGFTATYDRDGFLYSGSIAFGVGYVTTVGAFDTTYNGGTVDIAITKYDTTGTKRIYSTYLGGSDNETPNSLVVNSNDELYILGITGSNDFPTTSGAFDTTFASGGSGVGAGFNFVNGADIIISKLSSSGSELLSSTYIGGKDLDGINYDASLNPNYADEYRGEIILDKDEKVYIATSTMSSDMPIKFINIFGVNESIGAKFSGEQDGYVAKLDENLSTIFWSRYVGGSGADGLYSLDVTDSDIFCSGGTNSLDFYTTENAYQDSLNITSASGIVLKFDKNLGKLKASTLYGKSGEYSQAYMTKLDKRGYVYVYGQIQNSGSDFNENTGFGNDNGSIYISTLSNDLTTRIWSTSFGGVSGSPLLLSPSAFSVGVCAKIFLSGWGSTNNFPVTPDAFQSNTDNEDFYIMLLDIDASELVYATYFGGNGIYDHVDGGTSRFDKHGIIYQSVCAGCWNSDNFPIVPPNAVSPTNNSDKCNNAVFKIDFEFEYVFADFKAPESCFLDSITFENTSRLADEYWWDFGDGNTSTEKNPTHLYDSPGLYIVTLVATNTGICNNSDEYTRKVLILGGTNNNLPTKQVCYGSDIQIGLSNVGSSFLTKWSPSYGLSNTTVSNPIASIDSTTTYRLLIDNGICVDTFYQTVEVVHFDFEVPNELIFCQPTLGVFIAADKEDTLSQLTWSRDASFIPEITPDSDSSITISVIENQVIYVKSDNQGCIQNKSIPIYIEELDMQVSSNAILCENETYTISASTTGGHSGTYLTEIPLLGVNQYHFGSMTFIPPSYGWYQITVSDSASGCNTTDSVLISFIEDIFSIPQDLVICENDTLNLIAVLNDQITAGNGEWFPKDSIISAISDEIVLIAPKTPSKYWFTTYGTNSNCQYVDSLNIGISDPQMNVSDDLEICAGDTISLTAWNVSTDGSILKFYWKPDVTIIGPDTVAEILVSPKKTGYYVVHGVNQLGCVIADSVFINFADMGVSVSPDVFICLGDTATLFAQISSNLQISLEWSPAEEIIDGLDSDDTIKVNPVNSTFFTLHAQDGGNCKSSYGIQVVVNEDQLVPSQDIVLCIGDTARLSLVNKFPQFTPVINWQPFSEIIGPNNKMYIDVAPTQDTYYKFLATYKNECPVLDSILVEVSDIQVSLPPYGRFCENETVSITATNLDNTQILDYSWTTASEIVSGENAQTVVIAPLGDTTLHLVVNNQFGCQKAFDVPIYISHPDFEVSKDTILCVNELTWFHAINNNALDTFTYSWSGLDLTSPIDKDSVSLNPQQSQYILVSGVNQIGCVKEDSILVVVAPDQIQLAPSQAICQGDSIWLKATALYEQLPVDYQWSGPNIISEQGDSILVNPNQPAIYDVSITTSGNCTFTVNYPLDVIVIHVVTSNDVLICDGTSTDLQIINQVPSDILTHTWLPNLGGNNTLETYQVSPDTSTIFVVHSENTIGCKRTDSVLVALASEYTFVSPDNTICFGDTIAIQAFNRFPQFQADYLWSFSHSNVHVLSDLNDEIMYISPDTNISVFLRTTTGLGCDPIDSMRINVSKIILDIPDTLVVCIGDTSIVVVKNLLSDQVDYDWTYAGNIIGDNTEDSLRFVAETDGILYLETTNELGCQRQDEIPFSVTFVDYSISDNMLLCPGTSGQLQVINNHSTHVLTYEWTPNHGMLTNNDVANIIVQPDSTTRYYVTMTNPHGCIAHDSSDAVLTNDMLKLTPDTIVCAGDIVTLRATNLYPEFNITYQWKPIDEILSSTTEDNIQISVFEDVLYTLKVDNQLGCSYYDSIAVHVSALSLLTFEAFTMDDSLAYGGTTQVWVEPINEDYNYHWEPANVALFPDSFETAVTLHKPTVMKGQVTDGYCVKDFSVFIYVTDLICDEPNIFIPNAFTPNNDGENDVLFVRGNNLTEVELKVYDRWGELVFETQEQQHGWNGVYKGKELSPAVFVYHLKAQCENNLSYFKKGNITLIR